MTSTISTSTPLAEDTSLAADSEFFMAYEDAEGNEQNEPACALCVKRFSFSDRHREILERSLEFVGVHECFAVTHWQEITAQGGSSDWQWVDHLRSVEEALKKAPGLFDLSFAQMRAIYGSVQLTIAADLIPPDERDQALAVLGLFDKFHWHLHSQHCGDEDHNIGEGIVDALEKPHYVGSLNIKRAWSLSSKLRGKSMAQVRDVFQEELDGTLEEIRVNLATAHGGRRQRLSVLETALSNAVTNIQVSSEAWLKRAKESIDSGDLIYLAGEIHQQVFLVDELLVTGCRSDDPNLNTPGGRALYRAMDEIRDLVDWDECPTLKRRMEEAEGAWAERKNDDVVEARMPTGM